jgi:hypothetical protein
MHECRDIDKVMINTYRALGRDVNRAAVPMTKSLPARRQQPASGWRRLAFGAAQLI